MARHLHRLVAIDSLEGIREELRRFASEREWEQFHLPRNLTLALVGEVGELAEQMQWDSDKEIIERAKSEPDPIADELADVAIYLVRLSDVLGIELGDAIEAKIDRNGERFPSESVRGLARPEEGSP